MSEYLNMQVPCRTADCDLLLRCALPRFQYWTAQMFLMFSLAQLDVLPVDDLGIRNAIQRNYTLNELPSGPEIESIAQPWRPYATIACWYLWRSLENSE